ncbi:hypothetical protein GUITHDRAFT_139691 [Guillardia theta CCMP2712]|uniref:1,4-dihydroxy-2-naphthoate octaprenyltransferase n=1 Tax=Guillardia theta (strain CCMP2712) TaxID=905079 RepID=L1J8P6_GUITC|nr:hypothetical protein GUITHDRAFT_139691 [Guillardia theta CCMP2712]EKX44440.1 hypothetical protein GUITHDRAFT_139691 [Guillardia theta CCMP2712]|mmetsp:Transcript_16763/g.55728  ORF Transcript_16763/g.55728 Transcript_16763/m.55728 type:complete len:301 (-) Transcript_16763:44-946(-)|eukprot:XP_005831420.1 hypothetical protein GUITHDRAFT_139691 [Guillardia theta CCMP2712]
MHPLVVAMRPWTFPAALVPVLLTVTLVHRSGVAWSLPEMIRAILLGVIVQAASNVINTYWDYENGVDGPNVGSGADPSVVLPHKVVLVGGGLKPRSVLALALVLYGSSLLVLLPRFSDGYRIPLLYLCGTSLSYFYTAPPFKLKYFALGDAAIFIAFGPLLVYCTILLVAPKSVDALWGEVFGYTIPCSFICECILHANNSRDIGEDSKAGLVTLATILGFNGSKRVYVGLITAAYVTVIIMSVGQRRLGMMMVLLSLPLAFDVISRFTHDINRMADLPKRTAKLHMAFGLLLIVGVLIN